MKILSILLLLVCSGIPALAAKKYSYFRVGNANDVNTSTTPGTVLMGGGTDVDAAFQWMCQRSGNGDFLVIRATGTDAYNPYIQQLCPNENSVATLIIPNLAAASDPFVISTIQNAEALWIAGGDQSNYINFWKGTPSRRDQCRDHAGRADRRHQRRHECPDPVCLFRAGQSGSDLEPVAGGPVQPVHHARP